MRRAAAALVAAALLAAACSHRPAPEPEVTGNPGPAVPEPPPTPEKQPGPNLTPERIGLILDVYGSLDRGHAYLLKRRDPDGAWRSDTYATFKGGPALTPLALHAIQLAEVASPAVSFNREKDPRNAWPYIDSYLYLMDMVRPDGTIDPGPDGFDYPVYTAALAVMALTPDSKASWAKVQIGADGKSGPQRSSKDMPKARDAWVKYLLDRQLTEALGWNPEDKQYGGWGYCRVIPRKPEPNRIAPPLIESNLSATVFALEALRAAGVTDKAVYEKALAFVRRCQNEDGGFFFIYDDPVRNKAGTPDPPTERPTHFHSYGSTTADGLRALLLCGVPADDPTVRSALAWLAKHFRADSHPGTYVESAERNREAVYFYYVASVSRALRLAKVKDLGGKDWAAAISAELARRQRDDGSWANPVELVRENEPLVATAQALIAVANCQAALDGQ